MTNKHAKTREEKEQKNIVVLIVLSILALVFALLIIEKVYLTGYITHVSPTPATLEEQIEPRRISTCFKLRESPPIMIEKVCYNRYSKDTEVTLKRVTNYQIYSLTFLLSSNQETLSIWQCGLSCGGCSIHQQGTKTYYLYYPEIRNIKETQNSLTIRINACILETKELEEC